MVCSRSVRLLTNALLSLQTVGGFDKISLLFVAQYQANLQGELRVIESRYQSVKTYDRLTSCAAGAAATRKEQYGVRVTALNEVLVGAEGRCEHVPPCPLEML